MTVPAPSDISKAVQIHENLNPRLWKTDRSMRPEVRVRLLRAAISFYEFLEVPKLRIADIVLTGSNASFNYTRRSDLDVHLIVDYERTTCPDLAENFFGAKKNLWNLSHDIVIRGHDVELFVEDEGSSAISSGIYSILRGEWNKSPTPNASSWDDNAVLHRTRHFASQIEALISAFDPDQMQKMLHKLRAMRQAGLEAEGEFSVENLTFKSLRALGYLDRLRAAMTDAADKSLSL